MLKLFSLVDNLEYNGSRRPGVEVHKAIGEPLSSRVNKDNFSRVWGAQLFRTCSNHRRTRGSRLAVKLDMTLRWFNLIELPWTTELQREQGSQDNFSCAPGGSMLPNSFEPLSSRGNKDHMIMTSVFRRGSVGLNNPKLMSSSTPGLVPGVVLWFEQLRKSWTTPDSWMG